MSIFPCKEKNIKTFVLLHMYQYIEPLVKISQMLDKLYY